MLGLIGATISARADEIDSLVRSEMAKQHIAGLSLAVIRNGKIEKAQGYGLANVELNVKANRDTVYEIGSMTKQFTALGMLLLAEEGKLSLDDPVSKYLDGAPPAWGKITIRHCLTHTAGLKDYLGLPDFGLTKDVKKDEFVGKTGKYPLDFQPGEGWMYSNTGYYLAGLIIERVANKSWEEFIKERIFKPLGMNRTYTHNVFDVIPNRASGYSWAQKQFRNAPPMGANGAFAAGAILSSVTDLAKWDAALVGGKLVRKQAMESLWSRARFNSGRTYPYGMGWFLPVMNGHKIVAHGGNTIAYSSDIFRYPDGRLTIIILTNRSVISPESMAGDIAKMLDPALRSPALAERDDPDAKTTIRLLNLLRSAGTGKPEKDGFTGEMWAEMSTQRGLGLKMQLGAMGRSVESMGFVERKNVEGERHLSYRLHMKPPKNAGGKPADEESPLITFVLTEGGQLARLESGD